MGVVGEQGWRHAEAGCATHIPDLIFTAGLSVLVKAMWGSELPHRGCQMVLGAGDCEVGRPGRNALRTWITQFTGAGQAEPHVCVPKFVTSLERPSEIQGSTWSQVRKCGPWADVESKLQQHPQGLSLRPT